MNGLYDEIRIALYSVWNRRWLALAVAWALCLVGWIVVAMQPNSYESKARILVQTQNILSDQPGSSSNELRKNIDQLEQTIASGENLKKVVRGTDLGLKVTSDKEMEGAVASLRSKIEVKTEEANFFDISASQSSPKLAREVVQKLIDIVQEGNIAGDRKSINERIKFFEDKVTDTEKLLSEAEAKRVKFETENLGLLPGIGSVSQRIEAARSELNQIETQLVTAQSALAALNGQLASTSPTINTPNFSGGGRSGGGGAAGALSAARGELSALRSRGLTDRHPDVIALRRQIASLRSQASSAPRPTGGGVIRSPNPAYSSLQTLRAERSASTAALQARKGALQSEVAQLTSKQSLEPGVAAEMEKLNSEYDTVKSQYDRFVSNLNSARLNEQVDSETDAVKFNILDQPTTPTAPSAPNRPLLLAMVLILGLGAGGAVAFAMGHIQTSFPTASRLEKASGLPVIGSVSLMLTEVQKSERTKKLKLFLGGTASLLGVFALLIIAEFFQRGLVV